MIKKAQCQNKAMLTKDQFYILSLLRESFDLEGSKNVFLEDHQYVISTINRNGILLTVYNYLPEELKDKLSKQYHAAVKQAIVQEFEGKQVLKALSDAGLLCIALKGWELRTMYPAATMRQMADLDILVKPYNYNNIKTIMEKLGFSCGTESSWKHDYFKKNEVNVEMHKRLTDDSALIQAWEAGLWDRAATVDTNIFKMSAEDYYIFHFVHLYKDFINGSLGLRRIVDTWLLQKQSVNMGVVKQFLKSFGMWNFYEQMIKLSLVTMGERPIDDDSELLLSHAFTHGIYGSGKSYKAGRIAAMGDSVRSGKIKSMLAAVFLPYGRMKAQFPVLKRWPILLPYCWVKRIIRFLQGDMNRNLRMLDYSDVSEADYKEMIRFFKAGGVNRKSI